MYLVRRMILLLESSSIEANVGPFSILEKYVTLGGFDVQIVLQDGEDGGWISPVALRVDFSKTYQAG